MRQSNAFDIRIWVESNGGDLYVRVVGGRGRLDSSCAYEVKRNGAELGLC